MTLEVILTWSSSLSRVQYYPIFKQVLIWYDMIWYDMMWYMIWYMIHGLCLRSLACWDCAFESHRGHGSLSAVGVACCQVEVSATDWSLVQRSPTDCGASLCVCDQEFSKTRRLKPATWLWKITTTMGCNAKETNKQTNMIWYDVIYLLTAIGLTPGGSSTTPGVSKHTR